MGIVRKYINQIDFDFGVVYNNLKKVNMNFFYF
jgi:hypothetical protein